MIEQTHFDSCPSEHSTGSSDHESERTGEPEHTPLDQARDLDSRLVAARRAERGAQHRLAVLLAEMADGSFFRLLGYTSIERYANNVPTGAMNRAPSGQPATCCESADVCQNFPH